MDNLELKKLIGNDVAVFLYISDNICMLFDETKEVRISNLNAFWRLSQNGDIICTSNDFYIKKDGPLDIAYAPLEDAELEELLFDEEDVEFGHDKLYEKLETVCDERIEIMKNLLEGASVESAEELSNGDMKMSFSNGIYLEVFRAPCSQKKPRPAYELRIR